MKVKKLEITGFKSFYDRSTIEFPPGISAVVGPNGCGKSNIIDAIRWVMGEQSLKQLRGKSKEDIIFSGANGRAAMNMAEVSLTLANDNGNAPEELKDFTKINLTRRLYRSGETAYLLNRQPCRLKDIHNIFLGSGLGSALEELSCRDRLSLGDRGRCLLEEADQAAFEQHVGEMQADALVRAAAEGRAAQPFRDDHSGPRRPRPPRAGRGPHRTEPGGSRAG